MYYSELVNYLVSDDENGSILIAHKLKINDIDNDYELIFAGRISLDRLIEYRVKI